jgi:hypothetical protein
MKRHIIICFLLLTGCTTHLPHYQFSDYFKPRLEDLYVDDLHISELYKNDFVGPIFKYKRSVDLHDKKDTERFFHLLFDGNYKEVSFKGIQEWKYILTFHHLEGNYREHRLKISEEGILCEGAFYPFGDTPTKETLFDLIEEYLSVTKHTMK